MGVIMVGMRAKIMQMNALRITAISLRPATNLGASKSEGRPAIRRCQDVSPRRLASFSSEQRRGVSKLRSDSALQSARGVVVSPLRDGCRPSH